MQKLIPIGLTIMLFSVSSCQKDSSAIELEEPRSRYSITNPANSLNDQDSAGYYHNQILDDIILLPIENLSEAQLMDTIEHYAQNVMGTNDSIASYDIEADLSSYWTANEDSTITFDTDGMISDMRLDQQSEEIALRMVEIIMNYENSYDDLHDLMVSLEDSIINNSFSTALTTTQQSNLLRATSVARYSGYFWLVEHPDEYDNTQTNFSIGGGIIAVADALGALLATNKACDGFWNRIKCAALGAGVLSASALFVILVEAPYLLI